MSSCIEKYVCFTKIMIFLQNLIKLYFSAVVDHVNDNFLLSCKYFIVLRASPAVTWLTVYRWLSFRNDGLFGGIGRKFFVFADIFFCFVLNRSLTEFADIQKVASYICKDFVC